MKRPTPNITWEDLQREKEAYILKLAEMKNALKERLRRERMRYMLHQLSTMKRGPKPPSDAFTVQDYIKHFGVSNHRAMDAIEKLVKSGVVKRIAPQSYYVVVPGGLAKWENQNSNVSGGRWRTSRTKNST